VFERATLLERLANGSSNQLDRIEIGVNNRRANANLDDANYKKRGKTGNF